MQARDVFEEAINTVITVRDFSHIWDAYTQFEDSLIAAKTEMLAAEEGSPEDLEEETDEFELMVARYEHLIDRRALLLSSVLLRQNPHNVSEWHKRVKLYEGNPKKIVETYTTALATVDHQKAKGKPSTLWIAFARYYSSHNRLDDARKIYEKATLANFRGIDELASLWCSYAEMEIMHQNYEVAHSLLQRATVSPRRTLNISEHEPVQVRTKFSCVMKN
jgi:pre-mRNA-splicing factor SYF1